MSWEYAYDKDAWIKGSQVVTDIELHRMSLADVMLNCPGLLLIWWKHYV